MGGAEPASGIVVSRPTQHDTSETDGMRSRIGFSAAACFPFPPHPRLPHRLLFTNFIRPRSPRVLPLLPTPPPLLPHLPLTPTPFDMASVSSSFAGLLSPMATPATLSSQTLRKVSTMKLISFGVSKGTFPCLRSSRLRVCCAAKPETVVKVCEIVRRQLALPAETALNGESTFSALGADSLDTVEIVMGLEEEFGITVEEDGSQNITTVQEAADLIEALVQKKGEAA